MSSFASRTLHKDCSFFFFMCLPGLKGRLGDKTYLEGLREGNMYSMEERFQKIEPFKYIRGVNRVRRAVYSIVGC